MGPKQRQKSSTRALEEDQQISESFSPVNVPVSPALLKQGNLTGSARKLKDSAADLHNLVQKWDKLNTDGANILSEMANIKLECILSETEDTSKPTDMLPECLLPLCDNLSQLLHRMEKIVVKLTGLVEMSKGVSTLEQYNQSDNGDIVLFQTWDITKFENVFEEIGNMYQKELSVKKSVAENICHCKDRNTVMFHTATWVHQPYIDTHSKLLLESMLFETKHKT